jgi:hypothetical protein
MQIGEEMDSAIDELRELLSHPQEKNRQIERIGNKVMSEIRPQIDELQAELLREVHTEIGTAFENVQDDLHMQQATLTKATDEKLRLYNQSLKSNVNNLQADLRKEAELLDLDLRELHETTRNQEPAESQPQTQPSTPEQANPRTKQNQYPNNPYNRPTQVSPHQTVHVPTDDAWNMLVSKCKEKVTLTYPMPPHASELTEIQAEAFYRQTESNFKGYPAVRLREFEDLTRRGNSIPNEYTMGWPPACMSEGSAILYKKLAETIPHTMPSVKHILDQFQTNRDGYRALMTIMKRSTPRLGELPPKMELMWPKGVTPTEYANTLQRFIKQQSRLGRKYCDFEIAATMAQRSMEHQEHYNAGSNRAAQLVQMATNYEDFVDVELADGDNPHLFATLLETYYQGTHQQQINMINGNFSPSINKFERDTQGGGRNGNRPPLRDGDKPKPQELCPCCLRHGHNVEKGSACWMGSQVENVLKYNKDHPEQAKKNMENFKTALNPVTIRKMQLQFPAEFKGVEPDSGEMIEAAVELFEMFQDTE